MLVAVLAAWTVTGHVAPVRAQLADTSHLQTVRAEYSLMLNLYVKPLDPGALLDAAWGGAVDYLRRQGVLVHTSTPRLAGDRDQAFAGFSTAWTALAADASGAVDLTQVAFAADDAMANSVNDDHTYFLTPDLYDVYQQELGGADATQVGVGVDSNPRPPHVVLNVAPGGPAEQAGIRPGDAITAIDGRSVEFISGAAYQDALSGPAGAGITITVRRPGQGSLDLSVVLGPFHFPIFSAKLLPGGVGYMQLHSFVNPYTPLENNQTVVQQLDAALESFEAAGATEWVLDLRDNGGGIGLTNQAVAGRFLADGRSAIDADGRGHHAEELVDGHAFRVQRPLAVLVNGGSASSSEVVAATLHEYGRAVLVGSRTAGALGTTEILPLPDGAAAAVTVSTVVSGRYGTPIDNAGVPVDVEARRPSLSDLAAGRDPGIDAAEAALAGEQPFTPAANTDATLSQQDVRAALGPYEVSAAEVPPAPEIHTEHFFGDYVINRYNEWNNLEGPGRDAFATRDLARQRGWQGATLQFFGEQPLGPQIGVVADLYATADGAAAAMNGHDFPDLLVPTTPPLQLGDQTVAYRGQWLDTGSIELMWRHGRLLLTVTLSTVPGEETFDPLVTLAQTVESHYQASPLGGSGQ